MTVYLREDIAARWSGRDPMQEAFSLEGEIYRNVARRKTLRVSIGGKYYFVKLHFGVGWVEVFKNWLQLKRPVLGAENEYQACRDLAATGLAAPLAAAYGMAAGSLASRRSFVLCDELTGRASLEDVTERWPEQGVDPLLRLRMLKAVAEFARAFHGHGFIHRDFYICHLLTHEKKLDDGQFDLAVLDLHRARRFDVIPRMWLKRDLAALLFSTLDLGYTRRDWLRFIHLYTGRPLREELAEREDLWASVLQRAEKLYNEGLRKGLVKGLYKPSGSRG